MVGVDEATGDRVAGDAMIDVHDFADPDVDIALTGIVGANGGTWAPLRWENVPLAAGGFRSSDASGFVSGLLYGPDPRRGRRRLRTGPAARGVRRLPGAIRSTDVPLSDSAIEWGLYTIVPKCSHLTDKQWHQRQQ